jgi:hypothetical protein
MKRLCELKNSKKSLIKLCELRGKNFANFAVKNLTKSAVKKTNTFNPNSVIQSKHTTFEVLALYFL